MDTFNTAVTGETQIVNHKLSYNDKYLIHLLTCSHCRKQCNIFFKKPLIYFGKIIGEIITKLTTLNLLEMGHIYKKNYLAMITVMTVSVLQRVHNIDR